MADAVEEAMTSLDPADCDGLDRRGHGGVPESARERLDGLCYDAAEIALLNANQRVALCAVVHCVQGIPKGLANDPGTLIEDDFAVLCAAIDSATGAAAPSRGPRGCLPPSTALQATRATGARQPWGTETYASWGVVVGV
ncbi:hypothetical protein ABT034_33905 [Streptomyces sp. NPDC002773]|uniref:hypothetical protein n=1 Tax=Streptomyces sp. NPDC002773 TaxID=3154430 RepID=UPI0033268CEC